jgi:hypothetical protein
MESLKRLGEVLWAPTETFRRVAERPTWAVALVVLLVLQGAVTFLAVERIDPEAQRQAMQETLEDRGLRGDELERQLDTITKAQSAYQPFAPVIGVVFGAGAYLLVALLFWVAFRLLGGELAFPQAFATVLHAFMPLAIAGVLAIPVILGQETLDPEAVQRGSFLASNLAFLAPEDASGTVLALLTSVDLFTLWAVALLVLGFRVVARVSTGAAAAVAIGLWAVWIGIKVGLAAVFG